MTTAIFYMFICCLILGGFGLAALVLAVLWYPIAKWAGIADSLKEWLDMF